MSESVLLMSWRIVESLRFNSSTCSTLKLTGWLGKPMANHALIEALKASQSSKIQRNFKLRIGARSSELALGAWLDPDVWGLDLFARILVFFVFLFDAGGNSH